MTNTEQELSALVGRITGRLMSIPYLIDEPNVGAHDALEALLVEIGQSVDTIFHGDDRRECPHESDGEDYRHQCAHHYKCIKCGEFYR